MPTHITVDDDTPILVELRARRGVVDASRTNEQALTQKSAEALNSTVAMIYTVAKRTGNDNPFAKDCRPIGHCGNGIRLEAHLRGEHT